mmetsp:Transcript_829/g.1186  ORF Transcript_829/g.1186 Transcript_829/m.1186 type:complete len:148 (-) Transcript_829:98-541(-)|eukprot:CAMPEP_0196582698 /NCGR_PEP_ID=MMETSP1081-20130531/40163_1 /TAXON_ID=36882 /ORGANISM="Pyramimonas amylifera, Strain CCMP720" /LENGTH=147 /DNA_ID=CAMNT_0041903339 /DNA_START=57 /DNA_END=500 /DNA_ORIENTATION=+
MDSKTAKKWREMFDQFDHDECGRLDLWELRGLLSNMGRNLSEGDLPLLLKVVDEENHGSIGFFEILELLDRMDKRTSVEQEDVETVAAFVSMGGNSDMTGEVNTEKLKKVVKDYKLSINIEGLLKEIDTDRSGYIDFEEFKALIGSE